MKIHYGIILLFAWACSCYGKKTPQLIVRKKNAPALTSKRLYQVLEDQTFSSFSFDESKIFDFLHYHSLAKVYPFFFPALGIYSNHKKAIHRKELGHFCSLVDAKNMNELFASIVTPRTLSCCGVRNAKEHYASASATDYATLMKVLFPGSEGRNALVAFANSCFEWAFSPDLGTLYENIIRDVDAYVQSFFINAVMHNFLSDQGGVAWHNKCLEQLTQEFACGKKIVHFGLTDDVGALLEAGIYNIKVIDAGSGWMNFDDTSFFSRLVKKAELGDVYSFLSHHGRIYLECKKIETGKEREFHIDHTSSFVAPTKHALWSVTDEQGQLKGVITIQFRPFNKYDFLIQDQAVLVMSYTDFVRAAFPRVFKGMGIDFALFPEQGRLYIRQLRKPITRDVMLSFQQRQLLAMVSIRFPYLSHA